MITKYKSTCAGCHRSVAAGENVTGKKLGGMWNFLCVDCEKKIRSQGNSAWWNPGKALAALIYYNCELSDTLDHHDWALLRLFGKTRGDI